MRWAVTLAIAVLGGCTSLPDISPDIDFQIVVAAVQSCEAPPVSRSDPTTVMEVGFTKVKAACEIFFSDATKLQQEALASTQALDAGLIGATSIINATSSAAAAAKAITITTAGVVLSKQLIGQYVSVYTFNTHLYKVRQLVKQSMEDYVSKARNHQPLNYCQAYSYISDLASLCTLAAMKANIDQQVALPSTISTDGTAVTTSKTRTLRSTTRFPSTNYTVKPGY
jgi:hypothetical protein